MQNHELSGQGTSTIAIFLLQIVSLLIKKKKTNEYDGVELAKSMHITKVNSATDTGVMVCIIHMSSVEVSAKCELIGNLFIISHSLSWVTSSQQLTNFQQLFHSLSFKSRKTSLH